MNYADRHVESVISAGSELIEQSMNQLEQSDKYRHPITRPKWLGKTCVSKPPLYISSVTDESVERDDNKRALEVFRVPTQVVSDTI